VGQGTGLGLSISYRIINDHEGHIRVHQEPNGGTSFIISLPTDLQAASNNVSYEYDAVLPNP
jgi:signal transduction histidine kinase